MFLKKIVFPVFLLLSILFYPPANAASEKPKIWADRFYAGYDTTLTHWEGISDWRYSSLNSQPFIDFKPDVEGVRYEGYFGVRIDHTGFPFYGGENNRLEFGGSYETGSAKANQDTPPQAGGPFLIGLENDAGSGISLAGQSLSDSFTYRQNIKKYEASYKADYILKQIKLTPSIGAEYIKMRSLYYDKENLNGADFQEITEQLYATLWGIKGGVSAEALLPFDFSVFGSLNAALLRSTSTLRAIENIPFFDASLTLADHDGFLTGETQAEIGLRKKLGPFIVTVSAGLDYWLNMPRVQNPVYISDNNTQIIDDNVHNWFVKFGVDLYF